MFQIMYINCDLDMNSLILSKISFRAIILLPKVMEPPGWVNFDISLTVFSKKIISPHNSHDPSFISNKAKK